MANRSLAAKQIKAQKQARAYAQTITLRDMSEPHISKADARWLANDAPSSEDGGYHKVVSRRRHRLFEPESMSEFRKSEAQHNVLSATNVTHKKPSRRFQAKPRFAGTKEDEFGQTQIVKPLNASTGGAGDWARRTGAKIDVGMSHVLRFYDMIFDQNQAKARMDRADENARQER